MQKGIINDLRKLKKKSSNFNKKQYLNSLSQVDDDFEKLQKVSASNIKFTLLTDSEEDFSTFRDIITNKNVIFNSWLIQNSFDMTMIKNYCDNFDLKINLTLMDDPDLKLPQEIMELVGKYSSIRLALKRFFDIEENLKVLKELYHIIIKCSGNTELGYFKFEDQNNNLLGGGALIPVESESNGKILKVDLAIHVLNQRQGIGDICLNKMFHKAFAEYGINEIRSRSAKDDIGVTNFMCKHGMTLKSDDEDEELFYFIDKKMWESLEIQINK